MKRIALTVTLLATPAFAENAPKSDAGTAFIQRCLADVTSHRIATLKRQVPEYAASLSEAQLQEGGVVKARIACPCFLQVAAVDPGSIADTPEERVGLVLAYLDSLGTDAPHSVPEIVTRLTRLCGERSSVLPPSWIGG